MNLFCAFPFIQLTGVPTKLRTGKIFFDIFMIYYVDLKKIQREGRCRPLTLTLKKPNSDTEKYKNLEMSILFPEKFHLFSSTIYQHVPYVNIYDVQYVFDIVDNPWDGNWLLSHWIY